MTTANAPERPATPQGGLLARYPLISFFVMAYAFSWIVWSPWVLSEDGVGLLPITLSPLTVGLLNATAILLGPTLSAFIMTGVTEGRAGIGRLLRRYVLWRVGLRWYLFVLVGIPVVMVLGAIVTPGALASFGTLASVVPYFTSFVLVLVLGGPLLEEGGWRGFALPRMQPLHGPLVASVIIGTLWALWHLPEFFVPSWAAASGGSGILDIVKFTVIAIFFAIVFTWVFNNTKGSLLIAVLLHTAIDAFSGPVMQLFPAPLVASGLPLLIGFGALVLVIVVLTRGRLSYQHYRQEEEPDPATAPT
jgi:membrane protease YdiL (CAAX protease family)